MYKMQQKQIDRALRVVQRAGSEGRSNIVTLPKEMCDFLGIKPKSVVALNLDQESKAIVVRLMEER